MVAFPARTLSKRGTESIWTFSEVGAFQCAGSAEVAFNFSHLQGAWRRRARATRKAVALS